MSKQDALKDMSFEQALGALEKIISDLESGRSGLADSISAYEQGVLLKKHCESKLKEAQEKIEKISIDKNGQFKTEPLDAE